MSFSFSSRRAAVGRPALLGFALALLIGLIAPIVLLTPRSAAAADAVTTTDLNLRAGPGIDRHVKLVMPPGAGLDLLSGLGDLGFYKVAYQGETGYAWGEHIAVGGDAGVTVGYWSTGAAFAADALNLRSGPSTSDRVLRVIPRGDAVTLTGGVQNGYAAAIVEDETGWVAEDFLDLTQGQEGDDPGSGDAGTAYATLPLNLRSGASLASAVIQVMPQGAEVTLTGTQQEGFAGVTYAGTSGWAWAEFLGAAPAAPAEPEPAAPVVTTGGDVVSIIYGAAATYGVDGNALLAVAQCESGLNPYAFNGSSAASGLFQFLPGTWATTPYAGYDVFDPWANANAAAWMWSVGRRGEWVC